MWGIGLEWWILYAEILFIGYVLELRLRDLRENMERRR